MLSAIKEVGILLQELNGDGENKLLSTYVEAIDSAGYPIMYCIVLKGAPSYEFEKVDLEEINKEDTQKYLYKKGSTRGPNYSPTAKVTDIERTYEIKVLAWFNTVRKNNELFEEYKTFLDKIEKTLTENKQRIIDEIKQMHGDKKPFAVTIKIEDKYLGDIDQIKNIFLELIADKENMYSGVNVTCSICGELRKKVSAGAIPFKFYTIDKPGFITGGFNKQLSWRNFPVCSECTLALIEGKKFLERHMSFSFYGLRYLLIPSFTWGSDEVKKIILEILASRLDKSIVLNRRVEDNLTTYEDDILFYLSEYSDNISLKLLFLRSELSAERILLIIDDVLPSRLRKLFAAKRQVDVLFPQLPFHFGRIRTFFAKSEAGKRENDLDKYFLEVINSIFKEKPINYNFLVLNFMREIRRDFNNEDDGFYYKTINAIEVTKYLSVLKLLPRQEVNLLNTVFDSVFNKYLEQLDTNEKRAIFLLGAMTKMLLNVQWTERKTQPFLAQLKGLKMNENDIKGLLPKVENKFREYDRFDKGKQVLAENIARLFLSSGGKWRLTVDEINFYFVCGMNLHNEIANIIYPKGEEKSES